MSIEKSGNYFILICDVCGELAEDTFEDFYDAVNYKKANGWKSKKYSVDWVDTCPECQGAD